MPELPEVETVRRGLAQFVAGHTITDTVVYLPKAVRSMTSEEFKRSVAGQTIRSVGRRGKYLLIHLSGGISLVVHLRMTGRLEYVPSDSPLHPHTRIVLHLDRGYDLRFMDMRTFGGMEAVADKVVSDHTGLSRLGPEPLSRDFTPEYMMNCARKRPGPVKGMLLNQDIAAGIGNIYADESLFQAGIHPCRAANSLSLAEWTSLCQAVRSSLKAGIRHRGTTVQNHQNLDGRPGSYQQRLKVYDRTGKPCPRCRTPIQKTRTAGRGTHFCPHCQPLSS